MNRRYNMWSRIHRVLFDKPAPCWNYIQNEEHIHLGKGVRLGPGVAIISQNHDPNDPDEHMRHEDVFIGDKCWLGANAVILPGVVLGPSTIVGAGAVVTRSFPDGNATIVGNPARLVSMTDDAQKQ